MSRYIEIIFDNSGSMTSYEGSKPKHKIAKEIFNDSVLPHLGKKGDELVLRTLRKGCEGISVVHKFSFKKQLKKEIEEIHDFNNNTPLYLTIKDSIKACSLSKKSEKSIFILTDGDDNCSRSLDKVLTQEELKLKEEINIEIILVQFVVKSKISRNNLSALSQRLKAQNVVINSGEIKTPSLIKNNLTNALIKSGINKTSKLPHCFDFIEGDNSSSIAWDTIEASDGIDFYLAELLHKEKLLSWKPIYTKSISETQLAELNFLYTLRFKNNLPESLVKQMLSQLKKPYKYTHDCIYWNFESRKWEYHKKETEISVLDNPDAYDDDNYYKHSYFSEEPKEKDNEIFEPNLLYSVIENKTNYPSFSLIKNRHDVLHVKELKDGDIVCFKY